MNTCTEAIEEKTAGCAQVKGARQTPTYYTATAESGHKAEKMPKERTKPRQPRKGRAPTVRGEWRSHTTNSSERDTHDTRPAGSHRDDSPGPERPRCSHDCSEPEQSSAIRRFNSSVWRRSRDFANGEANAGRDRGWCFFSLKPGPEQAVIEALNLALAAWTSSRLGTFPPTTKSLEACHWENASIDSWRRARARHAIGLRVFMVQAFSNTAPAVPGGLTGVRGAPTNSGAAGSSGLWGGAKTFRKSTLPWARSSAATVCRSNAQRRQTSFQRIRRMSGPFSSAAE